MGRIDTRFLGLNRRQKSEIVNFKVSEIKNGKEVPYESLESWNTKKTREEKANFIYLFLSLF